VWIVDFVGWWEAASVHVTRRVEWKWLMYFWIVLLEGRRRVGLDSSLPVIAVCGRRHGHSVEIVGQQRQPRIATRGEVKVWKYEAISTVVVRGLIGRAHSSFSTIVESRDC
jgi:hypothetical protein